MWCPQCKFVYNWETGRKETGNIHNPHAIRWEREHGKLERDINDIPCGGLVGLRGIPILQFGDYAHQAKVESIYRRVSEINVNVRGLVAKDSKDICRDYLIGEIDESKFQNALFIRDRNNERNQIKLDILTTLRTLMVERFREMATYSSVSAQRNRAYKKIDNFLKEAEEIRLFINSALLELCFVGTKKPPQMKKDWTAWDPKI